MPIYKVPAARVSMPTMQHFTVRNHFLHRTAYLFLILFFAFGPKGTADPVINEIFYHENHGTEPENPDTEWIELYNSSPAEINLAGWTLSQGVAFSFPPGAVLPGNSYLVIAADPSTFNTIYPGVDTGENIFGPWVGRLRNSGETITLRDLDGDRVDRVRYADEGDWAERRRGPLDNGHRGWMWVAAHDGEGASLELINPLLPNSKGQNWGSSLQVGGSPGAANSVIETNTAPLITNVRHTPIIPRGGEPVTVSAELITTATLGSTFLSWRVDGESDWITTEMTENPDGTLSSEIPGQADRTVVEFYLQAFAGATERTWPAPSQPDGNQEANALLQFDDSYDPYAVWIPGSQPKYRIVMTEEERAELADIGDDSESPRNEEESNAEMNCTFIVEDGTGLALRYLASVRNRGASSRNPPPNNFLVKFRSDEAWNGWPSVKFNAQYPHSQVFGSTYFRAMGMETAQAAASLLRVNGEDLARSGPNMFGSYARVESFGNEYVKNHWPRDPDGNLYQVRDNDDNDEEGDLRYEGPNPDSYRDTYFKKTNEAEDDWTDLIALTDALNNAPAESYFEDVGRVLNIDQWVTYFALDTLSGNREGGLITSKGDDYGLYRGISDPRFILVPHDLDTMFNLGNTTVDPDRSIWSFDDLPGLVRFFQNDEVIHLYYRKLLSLTTGLFSESNLYPMVDDLLGNWVEQDEIRDAKEWISERAIEAIEQVPDTFTATCDLPVVDGYFRTETGSALFTGEFRSGRVLSVLLNGVAAERDQRAGTWQLSVDPSGNFFRPGLNRITIQCFTGRDGSGTMTDEYDLEVWYDTSTTTDISGTLAGEIPVGNLTLVTRNSYLPSHPFLVRLEFRDGDGNINRNLWETTANLSTNIPGVTLTPGTVTIRNGLGSALVKVDGGADGFSSSLITRGATWRYLDDGSDQGTAWREREFNDETWRSGPAELGYGDNDEATEVRFGPNEDNDDNDEDEKFITTYFRRNFSILDTSEILALDYRVKRDDGVVIYLNGTVIGRDNVRSNPGYLTEASNGSSREDDFLDPDDLDFAEEDIHTLLVEGENTIAVEIHQDDDESSDISFDFELTATIAGTNPGDLTLTATASNQEARKNITSLFDEDVIQYNGTLQGKETTWSGIVRLTSDTTVPPDHTLIVSPGALILLDGDPNPEGTEGTDLIIQGSIIASGTESQPVTFTSFADNSPWGHIQFENSQLARFEFSNIHRAGHSPRGGHTNHGRVLRIKGSDVTFENCTISDNRAKIGETEREGGINSLMTFKRCHWARSVMGVETFDTGVLMEDCWITDMLGQYREDGEVDDNDAVYLHEAGTGQSLVLRRVVVANCEDDGIDTLGADVFIEDCLVRGMGDKGMSMLGGTATVRKSLFTNCNIGFSAKDDARALLDFCTITENSSIGIQAENKNGDDAPSFYDVSNSIIWNNQEDIRTDYNPADIELQHTLVGLPWPDPQEQNESNLNDNPVFVEPGNRNYHLTSKSPARDAANPNLPRDPDGTLQDLGCYSYDQVFDGAGSEIRWVAANGPYRITSDAIVPADGNLIIEAGTSVYFTPGTRLTVNGSIRVEGTPFSRVQFTSVPGAPFVDDPASEGLPPGPPKWDGLKIVDSMNPENRIAHIDVRNAQHREGSIGIIRSQCVIDDVRFSGTHIRMIYTEDASVIIENSTFPDMFGPDEQAAELGLDNISEHIKGEGDIPKSGRYIIRNNYFGTNKGHNDVVDVVSGNLPEPIVQILGNYFAGSRCEELDLGGDIYVAGNTFTRVFKDDETSDRGYANAISTGDRPDTTTMVARNIFWDVDHAISLKNDSHTIFENNTVYKIHPDFVDTFDNTNIGSAINLFVPGDSSPTPAAGAYAGSNIFIDVPRVFGNADMRTEDSTFRTPLEFTHNLVDPMILDTSLGEEHPGESIFDLGTDNLSSTARFTNPEEGDFTLRPGSPALGAGPLGGDLGALVPDQVQISGEPPTFTTSRTAELTIGGPGIFGYRYRINNGPWSEAFDIGDTGGLVPGSPTTRTAQILLSDLPDGTYTVHVQGRTFASEWLPDVTESRSWTIDSTFSRLVISEVLSENGDVFAHEGTYPDIVELHNQGASTIDLSGLSLSDSPETPGEFTFPTGATLAAGEFLVLFADTANGTSGTHLGFSLSASGEGLYLFDSATRGAVLLDSIEFGSQVPGLSIGRDIQDQWHLNIPTPGTANLRQRTGDPATLLINEWMAEGEVLFRDDWIEIHNPDPLPVALESLGVSDHPDNPQNHTFPSLSFIAGEGYLRLIADRNTAAGSDHVPFALDADGDRILLFDRGGNPIDQVIFGPQGSDISQGRWELSPTGLSYFNLPTAGLANDTEEESSDSAFLNALALLRYLRISEIMYEPLGGKPYEFLELRNTGPVQLNLLGVRFTNGISFTFPSIILQPGEEILVVGDLTAFESRYGRSLNVAGVFEGNLDNSGEAIALSLPHPFEAAILRFDYDPDWWPASAGLGFSLELQEPLALPRDFDFQRSWRQSTEINGTPDASGIFVPTTFPEWLSFHDLTALEDGDGDGLNALMEFSLGLHPFLDLGFNGPSSLPRIAVGDNGQNVISFDLPANSTAVDGYGSDDIIYTVEGSDNLVDWVTLISKSDTTSFIGTGIIALDPPFNGRVRVRFSDERRDLPARFLRLRVEYIP